MSHKAEFSIQSFAFGPIEPLEGSTMEDGAWTNWTIRASGEAAGRFRDVEPGDEGAVDEVIDGKAVKHLVKVTTVKWAEDGSVRVDCKRR